MYFSTELFLKVIIFGAGAVEADVAGLGAGGHLSLLGALGIAGVGAGLHVVMVDPPSLGDPIGSRLVLAPDAQYRVGHAYKPVVWAMACTLPTPALVNAKPAL